MNEKYYYLLNILSIFPIELFDYFTLTVRGPTVVVRIWRL